MNPWRLWQRAHSTGMLPCEFQWLKASAVLSECGDIIQA